MKKAKLGNALNPDKTSIYLRDQKFQFFYNGKRKYFSSNRECQYFIANINKTINTYSTELNYIYIDLFAMYRKMFQIIDFELFKNNFVIIDNAFSRSIKYSSENRNYFIFRDIYLIINELITVCNHFHNFELKRKNYENVHYLRMLLNRLEHIKNEITDL